MSAGAAVSTVAVSAGAAVSTAAVSAGAAVSTASVVSAVAGVDASAEAEESSLPQAARLKHTARHAIAATIVAKIFFIFFNLLSFFEWAVVPGKYSRGEPLVVCPTVRNLL